MSTARYLRHALLAAGLSLMAGAAPALAHDTMPDCAVNPANADCIVRTGPSIHAQAPRDAGATVGFWLPRGGDGAKPGNGG